MSRPYVILNAACSVDGRIATRAGDSRFSSEQDLRRLHELRAQVDAVMIGIGTLLADDPELSVRLVEGRTPLRVVVDSRARTPPGCRLMSSLEKGPVLIAVAERASAKRMRELSERGAEVLVCGRRRVDLRQLLAELRRRGVRKVLLEGGSELNWSMLRARLVDELRLYVRPVIVGGKDAKPLVGGKGFASIGRALRLRLLEVRKGGKGLYLRYRITP